MSYYEPDPERRAAGAKHTAVDRLSRAVHRIFLTTDGALLKHHFETEVLGTLSALSPTGDLVGHDQMLLAEGQKLLARKLIDLSERVTKDEG